MHDEACPTVPHSGPLPTPESLRQLEIFTDLPDDELNWLLGHGHVEDIPEGVTYVQVGDPAEDMFFLLEGRSHWRVDVGGQKLLFNVAEAGTVGGVLPYSRMTEYGGEAQAVEPIRLLRVPKECFGDLVKVSPILAQRLVALMSERVREVTRTEQQREKMMALGKLSAGLAHELNNPASAIIRAVDALSERLAQLPKHEARLVELGTGVESIHCSAGAIESLRGADVRLSELERADREDEVADWLDDAGVPDVYVRAETLVAAGLGTDSLAEIQDTLPNGAMPDFVPWFETMLAADQLLGEIRHAAERVSDLVKSIKQYSHMDRAPDRQPVDVHRGLDDTLTMLGHQTRSQNVKIVRSYADDLPRAIAHAGELNQVWTNLLDNALDALEDAHGKGGRLEVSTQLVGEVVEVRFIDDGHGIPDDIQERIFEPFFTTKSVGDGTGLGLDIVARIVRQNEGRLSVNSEPGRTEFCVQLPAAL
ncbi:MAG: ATP-binding protein [Acidobacteriota bacterium]